MGFEAEERAANARWERFLGQPIEPESYDTDEIEDIERMGRSFWIQGRGVDIEVAACEVCGAVVRKDLWLRHENWHDSLDEQENQSG